MGRLLFWSLVLVGLILIAAAVVMYLKRWFGKPDGGPVGGFTLGDLRELHRTGQMTDEEFTKARELIIGRTQAEARDTRTLRDEMRSSAKQNDSGPAGVQVKGPLEEPPE